MLSLGKLFDCKILQCYVIHKAPTYFIFPKIKQISHKSKFIQWKSTLHLVMSEGHYWLKVKLSASAMIQSPRPNINKVYPPCDSCPHLNFAVSSIITTIAGMTADPNIPPVTFICCRDTGI